jgi:hypothetical protein
MDPREDDQATGSTSSATLYTAMANAFYSGPRGDLAFKGKH